MAHSLFVFLVSFISFVFLSSSAFCQEIEKKESKPLQPTKTTTKALNEEEFNAEPQEKAGSEIMEKELKEEELLEEPSPTGGEPIIGAEIFEEQTPAENPGGEKSTKKEKDKKKKNDQNQGKKPD